MLSSQLLHVYLIVGADLVSLAVLFLEAMYIMYEVCRLSSGAKGMAPSMSPLPVS